MPAQDPMATDPMAGDPMAGGAAPEAPMDGGQMPQDPMAGEPAPSEPEGGDPKVDYLNQLLSKLGGDTNKLSAAEGYLEYLANGESNIGVGEAMQNEPAPEPEMSQPNGQQMAETVIFSKKQLKNINEKLRDNSRTDTASDVQKKTKNAKKSSPFNSPVFK